MQARLSASFCWELLNDGDVAAVDLGHSCRGPKNPTGIKPVQTKYKKSGSYGDDQDPSYTDSSEDYAKSYYAIQSKKHAEAASPKV